MLWNLNLSLISWQLGIFLNHYHGCCISCCCHRTSLCHCYGGESPLRLDLYLPTHSYSELHSSLNFQHFLTSDPKEPVIMFQLKVMTLITAQFWWDVTVLVLGATGSYWFQQRQQRLSFSREMAQLTASLHCARTRAEQMIDSNYHDMTWRSNQHSGNSHVHFLVTPLTFLLCGSGPKEWSLHLKQEALKTVQRHNTGLKQTAVWNLKAGQKISQQTPIVRCVRIISIFSVNATCFYLYSISDSWRHFVDPPLFVVLPHLSTFSLK